jgi:hypothetical protein
MRSMSANVQKGQHGRVLLTNPLRLRQYKSRISKWKLDKNVKSKEMETIVRKQLQRQFLAPERPALSFSVRHTEVDTVKIQRWMRRHGVPDNAQYLPDTTACKHQAPESENELKG